MHLDTNNEIRFQSKAISSLDPTDIKMLQEIMPPSGPSSLNDFLGSLLCNLLASGIFLGAIFILLRPRLHLSKVIAMAISENGEVRFYFKFCNKSIFRAYDIRIELYNVRNIRNNGNHIELTNIPILRNVSTPPSIAPYTLKDRFGSDNPNNTHEFAFQFRTVADLEQLLKDEHRFIRVQVEARHGLTGLQSIFVQDYDDISCIRKGTFQSGSNLVV